MSIEFKLPEIGEGVTSADVAEIVVAVGDKISPGQIVMELETEKAVVELPCPLSGTVEKILVNVGDKLAIGQPVMLVAEFAAANTEASKTPAPAATASPPEATASQEKSRPASAVQQAAAGSTKSTIAASPQRVEFRLPPVGEGVKSADVAEVLVKAGDVVAAGQPVMELETEKAVVELPISTAGRIVEILVTQGDSIEIGQHVLTIETTSSPVEKATAQSASQTVPARATEAPAVRSAPASTAASVPAATTVIVSPMPAEAEQNGEPVPAAPATRRLARQLGVDLRQVRGSGRGGRITQEDVQAHVREAMNQRAISVPQRGASLSVSAGSIAPPPLPDFSKHGPTEREALNKIARTAAENLTVSWHVIPHVTHHDRADITELEAARKRFGLGLGKDGPKVTQTAIVIKALATCLQAFPRFNSSLDPESNEIVFKRYYNIGCAVDTPHGLVVPVVKDCSRKSILRIASELTELAAKARERKLSIDSMQGATCTVTNLGGIGGVGFTPIINYPEVCILGMSRGQAELKLDEGKVVERLMLPLSLSYDHRVINGADAARFMVTLCNLLADPFQLLATV